MAVQGANLASGDGWFGIGFSSDGGMVGSDAVLSWVGGSVTGYAMSAKSLGGVKAQPASYLSLTHMSVELRDGKTLIKFTRSLAAGKVPLRAAEPATLLWAAGTSSKLSYHDSGRGSFTVYLDATPGAYPPPQLPPPPHAPPSPPQPPGCLPSTMGDEPEGYKCMVVPRGPSRAGGKLPEAE